MSASSIKAGSAYVELSTRQQLLDKGLAAAQASMRRLAAVSNTISGTMGKGFAAVGGALSTVGRSAMSLHGAIAGLAAASGVAMMVKGYADAAGNIDDMAQRTGLAAEEIQGLAFAAQMSGTSIEAVEAAVRKMQKSGMASGRGTLADFRAMAEQIAAIPDPAARAARAMQVFGKTGASLLPMLGNGAAGIDALMAEAQRMGLVLSGDAVAAGAEFGDAIDKMGLSLRAASNQIGAALMPMVADMATRVATVAGVVARFVAENQSLVASLFSVSTYLDLAAQGAAMLMGAIEYLAGTSGAMTAWIGSQWQGLIGYIMPIIDGISTALMSGQWAEAGKIAMLALEQMIRIGMQPLYNLWTDLYSFIAEAAVHAVTGVVNVFAGVPTAIMSAFSTVITWLTGTWDRSVNAIAKSLLYLYSLFDRSVDYKAAAQQMDRDAMARANQRQQDLDQVKRQRQQELDAANQSRAEYGAGLVKGIRDQASANKSQFDARIRELGDEIATSIERVNAESARRDEAAAALRMPEPPQVEPPPSPGQVADTVAAKTQGTFSGFAASLFGGGTSALDKLAKDTAAQTKILSEIAANTASDDALELS